MKEEKEKDREKQNTFLNVCAVLVLLKQGLSLQFRKVCNSLCGLDWPGTCINPSAFASQVLGCILIALKKQNKTKTSMCEVFLTQQTLTNLNLILPRSSDDMTQRRAVYPKSQGLQVSASVFKPRQTGPSNTSAPQRFVKSATCRMLAGSGCGSGVCKLKSAQNDL